MTFDGIPRVPPASTGVPSQPAAPLGGGAKAVNRTQKVRAVERDDEEEAQEERQEDSTRHSPNEDAGDDAGTLLALLRKLLNASLDSDADYRLRVNPATREVEIIHPSNGEVVMTLPREALAKLLEKNEPASGLLTDQNG